MAAADARTTRAAGATLNAETALAPERRRPRAARFLEMTMMIVEVEKKDGEFQ